MAYARIGLGWRRWWWYWWWWKALWLVVVLAGELLWCVVWCARLVLVCLGKEEEMEVYLKGMYNAESMGHVVSEGEGEDKYRSEVKTNRL